jgi:hypothetical protein
MIDLNENNEHENSENDKKELSIQPKTKHNFKKYPINE